MARNQQNTSNTNQNILLGVLAGTVMGAIAAVMINSTKAKEIREDLYDTYSDASKKFSNAAQNFSNKSHEYKDKFFNSAPRSKSNLNLTIGAVAGGILGVSAIVFLSSESGKGIREQLVHSFECISDKAHCIEDMAHSAASSFEDNVSTWVGTVDKFINTFNRTTKNGSSSDQPIDKFLDWAIIAAQFFQSIKK